MFLLEGSVLFHHFLFCLVPYVFHPLLILLSCSFELCLVRSCSVSFCFSPSTPSFMVAAFLLVVSSCLQLFCSCSFCQSFSFRCVISHVDSFFLAAPPSSCFVLHVHTNDLIFLMCCCASSCCSVLSLHCFVILVFAWFHCFSLCPALSPYAPVSFCCRAVVSRCVSW